MKNPGFRKQRLTCLFAAALAGGCALGIRSCDGEGVRRHSGAQDDKGFITCDHKNPCDFAAMMGAVH